QLGMRDVQVIAKSRAGGVLHAMVRPQDLRSVGDLDRLVRLPAGMRRRERQMSRRMPVLRQYHVLEAPGDAIDAGHDLVAARHRETAAGTEIVLDVDDEQDVVLADRDFGPHLRLLLARLVANTRCYEASRRSTSAASCTKVSATVTG